ncbi:MAG TPA: helix-turn-helix domain-containing protein [Terriglobales bacterium]|nr:helix-turn-helix domain-containing protein [Terriglobales bacterium]
MARAAPPDRLDQLTAAAVDVFIERGYRRTQMADVARAMGVAPGTLYLYVASKEALFDLVLRRAFVDGASEPIDSLPLPTPAAGEILARLRHRCERETRVPALASALARKRPPNPQVELTEILGQLYQLMARLRRAVKLIERSALDWPELAELYTRQVRQPLIDDLSAYLRRGVEAKRLHRLPHPEIAARLLIESTAWFAMHRHGDLQRQPIADEAALATITDVLLHGLLKE